jgi:PBP1b-binding outer membrane lipoprotein LpoB
MKKAIITALCVVLAGCQQPTPPKEKTTKTEQNINQKSMPKKEPAAAQPSPVKQNANKNINKSNNNMLTPPK